ncbi:hypothetical protein TELCIR_22808, partial [Teladorsagia circumcincta]
PPSPVEVVLPQPPVVADSESAEVDVTETIVLPKKTDKLDFTRRWLHDDLSSLAFQPPAPIMFFPEPCSYYNDADEHSLGSCSAEVAAINSPGRKEKPKRSNGYEILRDRCCSRTISSIWLSNESEISTGERDDRV